MTAEEIRTRQSNIGESPKSIPGLLAYAVVTLMEIAAQLAEIKQLIKHDALNQDPLDALSKAFARNASPQGKGRDET